ncbi:hypothetical protein BDW02DRAFT_461825, partial [Decorospora gaudefroyi]
LLLIPPLFLLLPIAAVINILESISKNTLYSHSQRNERSGAFEITLYGPATTGSDNLYNVDISVNIDRGPTLAILGTCVVAYAVAALGAVGLWELRKVEGTARHERMWTWIVFISNIIMIAASLGAFGYASSAQDSDKSWQRYEDVGKTDQEHTRETWACQIDKLYPNQDWAGSACGTAKGMRFLLVPLAISALFVFVSLWVLVRARGGLKWLFGGKGRYAGFQSVYEMRPPGPPSPYTGPPGPQWAPQPPQQWPGQPVQQWAPPPYQQWGPQPVQQWGPQPVQQWGPQPSVQVQKADATVEQR